MMNCLQQLKMTSPRAQVYLLLLIYITSITLRFKLTQAIELCSMGWFGAKCSYQCNCEGNKRCAFKDGSCAAGDRCSRGYFGPGCQYLDISVDSSILSASPYLLDGNDSTCNPTPNDTQAFINWRVEYVVFWFRMVVNNRSTMNDFQLILHDQPCLNQRVYPLTDTSMDITCDNTPAIQWIDLMGTVVGSLCSLYIIGGRNVALKQLTRQSSNSTKDLHFGVSSHAVDGNTATIYSQRSCTMTGKENMPTWEVMFDRPYMLGHISIYNNDDFINGLINFTIYAYNGQNIVFNITSHTSWTHIYEYNIESQLPSTSLRITSLQRHALSLCEVVILGEAACHDGFYGLSCEKTCPCSSDKSCNTVTGVCSAPCPSGRYGFRCQQHCSETCTGNCRERSGHCFSCDPGFIGAFCTKECRPGSYGSHCLSDCSENCNNTCDHVTGVCTCNPGHTGTRCTDKCPTGMFGVDCQSNCSVYCLNNTCDASTGSCTCTHNRAGLNCSGCRMGYFGQNCQDLCPAYCANKRCDEKTHTCFSCVDGFHGEYCESVADEEHNVLPKLRLLILMIPIMTLVILYLLVESSSAQPPDPDPGHISTSGLMDAYE